MVPAELQQGRHRGNLPGYLYGVTLGITPIRESRLPRKLPRHVGTSLCLEFSLRSRKCLLNAWQQTGGLWIPTISHPIPSDFIQFIREPALLTSSRRSGN